MHVLITIANFAGRDIHNQLIITCLTYSKHSTFQVIKSLSTGPYRKKRKLSPDSEAKYFCDAGIDQDGFKVKFVSKFVGYGVFTTRKFLKGEFLLEYAGPRKTENQLIEKDNHNRFLFGYVHLTRCWPTMIDGSKTDRLCKMVNDAEIKTKKCNCKMKKKIFNTYPRLCLFASRDIEIGEELRYDYGDDPKRLFWRHQVILVYFKYHLGIKGFKYWISKKEPKDSKSKKERFGLFLTVHLAMGHVVDKLNDGQYTLKYRNHSRDEIGNGSRRDQLYSDIREIFLKLRIYNQLYYLSYQTLANKEDDSGDDPFDLKKEDDDDDDALFDSNNQDDIGDSGLKESHSGDDLLNE
ncbi:hypothetical protein KUTeg_018790 [Tegillarca granosa]|uniref:SET domain-containing protein n=1 Tax=Tegillarca granosa TaxID=220873 RepID=A0ABQ9EET6_TEGGR|nr:hypothetical protein KUTeg_018790 [Tegillarca granosa]